MCAHYIRTSATQVKLAYVARTLLKVSLAINRLLLVLFAVLVVASRLVIVIQFIAHVKRLQKLLSCHVIIISSAHFFLKLSPGLVRVPIF